MTQHKTNTIVASSTEASRIPAHRSLGVGGEHGRIARVEYRERRRMKKNGFGLIELIVTIAIFSAISGVFIESYLKSKNTFDVQRSKTALQTATRNSLDLVNKWIKMSYSVTPTYTSEGHTYTTSDTTLVLEVPAIDGDQNIIPSVYDYVVFEPDTSEPNQLKQIIYPDSESSRNETNRIIGQNLSNIEFEYYNSSDDEITQDFQNTATIGTIISSEEVIHGTTNNATFNTKTKLRNKN